MHGNVFHFSELLQQSAQNYLEFVRVSSFSVGIYVLDCGAEDHQKPHNEDEVYYVVRGKAKMRMESEGRPSSFYVGTGTIIYMPAHAPHTFYDISERLAVLVFFGPKAAAQHPANG